MQEKKKSLGRGLEALLGASEPAQRTIKPDEAIHQLAVEKIGPGPFQPRRSIKKEQLKEKKENNRVVRYLRKLQQEYQH